ncbi:hypothetical protein Tco_0483570 [Tanacetum coccineum]
MGYVDVYVDVRQLHVSTGYTRHDTESQHTIAHEVTCQAAVRGATDDVCWACIRVVTLFYDMCVSGIMGGLDVVVLRRSRGRRSIDMYIARVLVSVYLYEWDEGVVLRCVTMERIYRVDEEECRVGDDYILKMPIEIVLNAKLSLELISGILNQTQRKWYQSGVCDAYKGLKDVEQRLGPLCAHNTVIDAAEAAKKQALSATSDAATRMVS